MKRRIDQWLANLGYCSRREARDLIAAGSVTVGGIPADDPGEKVEAAALRVEGEPLDHPDGLLLMLHKPLGFVCSHEFREGPRVYDLLPERWQRRNPTLTSIGRLDRDTSGLLLITDQTALVHQLTSPKHDVAKVYQATLDRPASPEQQAEIAALFAAGTLVLAGETKACRPAVLRWEAPNQAQLTLHEGKYHQVRRMFESQERVVTALHRSQIGPLVLPQTINPKEYEILPLDYRFF